MGWGNMDVRSPAGRRRPGLYPVGATTLQRRGARRRPPGPPERGGAGGRPGPGGRRHAFENDFSRGEGRLRGDAESIEQAVLVLVDNAAKYGTPGEPIKLTSSRRKRDLLIEVADRGPGIPPEELSQIFERFYQADGGAGGRRFGGQIALPGMSVPYHPHAPGTAGTGMLNVIDQVRSGTTEIAPAGHSATQRLQPLQKS